MRLLVLYQADDPATDHPGYYDGFERLVYEGKLAMHRGLGYVGIARREGWQAVWDKACAAAKEMKADAIFLHFFHVSMPDPSGGIRRLKQLPGRPIVFCSLGDPYGRWTRRVPRAFQSASALCDLTFLTGMGYLAQQLISNGSQNLVLMPHGCCQVRFAAPPPEPAKQPEFDVLFVGNRMQSRDPLSHFYWVAKKRVAFVEALTNCYGPRFGLFGKGWEGNASWQGYAPFLQQQQIYQRSAVVLGGTPNAYYDFYASDRPFIAAASGVPLVDYHVPGVERLLEPGRDWWLAHNVKETVGLCDELLQLSLEARHAIAGVSRARILAEHTQYSRCREMTSIVSDVQTARRQGGTAPRPELSFLRQATGGSLAEPVMAWVS
ncbi:glycosyltransferase [Terriglobus roseus]|uniref:Glycosyl transferases group 1 n=1 Tax=Terriglobus roseus TaxID=392734 RepID=A0A1H4IZ18_9BACT|nr:glycosyltransferase [Terriglobus roseus]SEB39283.1 Glycosyl transferases group 1 [Terriglobus roseus]